MELIESAPWLHRRAARSPQAEALRAGRRAMTYAELESRARRRAAALQRAGVASGDVVAVHVEQSHCFAELFHAIAGCGATLLPLNLRLTDRELGFQLADARARWLVHDAARPLRSAQELAAAGRHSLEPLVVDDLEDAAEASLREEIPARHPLALLYTSGTTGRPKGAVLTGGNIAASALASCAHLGVRPDDRWLACLPLFHVGGLAILVRSVVAGTSVVVQDRFDPEALDRAVDEQRVSLVSLVAAMLQRWIEYRGDRPAPAWLRCVLVGGGPTPAPLLERGRRLGIPVTPTYGLTEATSQVATRLPDDATPPLHARLVPLPGTELRVVDDSDHALGPGEAGEICVRGPTVMQGYAGLAAETAAALRGGWLHTGDVGRLDDDGRLEVLERRSDLIVSGGENVYPAEIEAVLLEHPDVCEAAVVGVPDPDYGQRPEAWVVPNAATVAAAEELARGLRDHCRKHLAGYKVPVRFRLSSSLPRTAAGKLLRRELRTPGSATPVPEH